MTPLKISAAIEGQIMGPQTRLDGLLASAVAQQLGMPPIGAQHGDELDRDLARLREAVAQLIKLDPSGFFWASDAQFEVEEHERRFVNRRFPVDRVVSLGSDKVKRVELGTGLSKSYRIPTRACFLRDDSISWFVTGNQSQIVPLLASVTHLGKKRSLGLGKVLQWHYKPIEPWQGFPIMRDGRPLRALPTDYQGLVEFRTAMSVLSFPYWRFQDERPCAVP